MSLDHANTELSRLRSIPEGKRTQSDLENIHTLEQIIDNLTMTGGE